MVFGQQVSTPRTMGWVMRLSGKWTATGADSHGPGLTELILLEIAADGSITGAVDDGDG